MRRKRRKANRKYKDRLFRRVFKDKASLLELYNALNGSSYTDPEALIITTLENVVYMMVRNDTSFIIGNVMNLYEHQSSYNPNMPLRGFFYFAELYRKFVDETQADLYGSSLIRLPLPRYMVFYNGKKKEPDWVELKLSDAFSDQETGNMEPCIEVKAFMVNINLGHNKELMERCRKLKEYAYFVEAVRAETDAGAPLEEAAETALNRCLKEGILTDILSANRREIINMILEEYDEQRHIENEKNISWKEGQKYGEKKERDKINELIRMLIKDNRLADLEQAAGDEEYQKKLLAEYGIGV